ncbi:MAG: hypothetical protein DMF53_03050 [Acidobacteria bacterium]|nr:MAG: hypothetical protein DMF53_03050 [Acidobacteriota bacterium]
MAPNPDPAGRSRQTRATAASESSPARPAVWGSPPRSSSVQSRATAGASQARRVGQRMKSRQAATRAGARLTPAMRL